MSSRASSRRACPASCSRRSNATALRASGAGGERRRRSRWSIVRLRSRQRRSRELRRDRQRGRGQARRRAPRRRAIGGKGKVVVLRYQEGSASTQHREKGSSTGPTRWPSVTVASDNQYGGATDGDRVPARARACCSRRGRRNGPGAPASSRRTSRRRSGCFRRSAEAKRRERRVKFVGFDASEKLLGALTRGRHRGARRAEPVQHGLRRGQDDGGAPPRKKVEARIDTGSRRRHEAGPRRPGGGRRS